MSEDGGRYHWSVNPSGITQGAAALPRAFAPTSRMARRP